jgi:two-component system chemotaxis sensor kinase CheA
VLISWHVSGLTNNEPVNQQGVIALETNEAVNNPSYIEMFKVETSEQLEKISEILAGFGKSPAETGTTVRELFRLFHNIKGAAGMMGLDLLKECMHLAENRLDEVRNGRKELQPEQVDQLLSLAAATEAYLNSPDWSDDRLLQPWRESLTSTNARNPEKSPGEEPEPVVLSEEETRTVADWHQAGKEVYGITVSYPPDAAMPGVAAFMFAKFLEKFGRILKTAPALDRLTVTNFSLFQVILLAGQALAPAAQERICSNTSHGENAVRIRKWAPRPPVEEPRIAKSDSRTSDPTIRVERAKLEKISAEVDELIKISREMNGLCQWEQRSQDSWNRMNQFCHRLERVSAFLQTDVLSLGMVQVKQFFSRIPLIVRDVAKQTGKQVEVEFHGETTEIDKKVAEKLLDPLTHLLRNAVDHGLEPPEERRKAGKPPTGRITVTACQEGDDILISLEDDGRGLDLEKIRAKAEKNGLVLPGQTLSEAEITQLIFRPGFSTAAIVSAISGRGVGLDVVGESILALQGKVEVDSVKGAGTTFRLKVPLTQAVIYAFLVRTDGQLYGFPLNSLENAVIPGPLHRSDEAAATNDLGALLNGRTPRKDRSAPVIIIKAGEEKLGLSVDELVGQERIMIKPLHNPLIKDPLFKGAGIESGGGNVIMLDPGYLIELAELQERAPTGNRSHPEYIHEPKVVDIWKGRNERTQLCPVIPGKDVDNHGLEPSAV